MQLRVLGPVEVHADDGETLTLPRRQERCLLGILLLEVGRPVPVHRGDSIVVHGQLYVDPGRAGVHCLHAVTSSGCPEAGWIQFKDSTYS